MDLNVTSLLIFQHLHLPAYQQKITECAAKIMQRYSEVQSSIVYENVGKLADDILGNEMANTTRIINIQKYSEYKKSELEPYYMLTVIIKNLHELKKYFDSVYRILGWNSRAKHFVIYVGHEDVIEIFKMSWEKYIVKLVVLDVEQDLYTYYPMEGDSCGKVLRKHFLFNCARIDLGELDLIFNAEAWSDFQGCKVKVLTFPVVPYVINTADAENPGFEITALNELAAELNFSIEYVAHAYTYWGVKNPDGTYTEMYDGFYRKHADIMLGMLVANGTFLYDFEASVAHTKSDLAFYVPPARKGNSWENITKVYTNTMWLVISLTAVSITFFWYATARLKQIPRFSTLSTCAIYVGGMLFSKPMLQPKTHAFRYVFIAWTFFCLILTSTFESSLMSYLTKPSFKIEISTLEELLASNLKIGGYAYAKELFKTYNSTYANWIDCDLNGACINATANLNNFAALSDTRTVAYLTPKYYTNPDGSSELHQLPITSSFYMWVLMLKGFPLKNGLDKIIQRFIEAGLMEKWMKEVSYQAKPVSYSGQIALNLQHVLFPLGVLAAGFVLGFLVLLVEILSKGVCRWNKSKLN